MNPTRPPTELLWGSVDPAESLRMARIIVNGGFLAITLNEEGAKSFTYLKGASAGAREVYYIDSFGMGSMTEAPMLRGQFLFEIEALPNYSLNFGTGGNNRIYFRMDGHQDNRVAAYDFLTNEEVANTEARLLAVARSHPEHQTTIDRLLATLER